jgi:protein gp37
MSATTAIEWTGTTWNPTTGCDRVSPGCDNCYALRLAKRLKAMGSAKYQTDGDPRTSGPGFGVTVHPDELAAPYRWRDPRLVFVNSMSDLFHARVPLAFVASVWAVMAATPQHTYQVLTKRPTRMRAMLGADTDSGQRLLEALTDAHLAAALYGAPWPLPNVWLGVSVEDADHLSRVDHLRGVPAAVRFVSCEPLLGPLTEPNLDSIDWVITGGESGPGARPVDPQWIRDIRDACQRHGVPFFFKQWGGRTPKAGGRVLDGRTWDQYPDVLAGVGGAA